MLNRISLRQMEYFLAAAQYGSIAIASNQIHISAPSISAAIAHMETELGIQLFIRHPSKGMTLTPIGAQVTQECEQLLDRASRLYEIASDSSEAMQGVLRVGCFQSLTPMIAPEVIFGFKRAFSKIDLQLVEGDQRDLMEKLRNGEIDVAITYDLELSNEVQFEVLCQLPPHVIVNEVHPLAQQNAVTLGELAPLPMVLLDLPMSRDYFLSLFAQAGVEPNIVARSRSEDVVRSLVCNGIGYALFNVRPKSNQSLDGKRFARLRLAGEHRPMLLGLATYAPAKQPRLAQVFMERCRAYISDQYIPGMSAASYFDPHLTGVSTDATAAQSNVHAIRAA
ncbi:MULTISPECIES: LysR substrate-binding domain-containing protein [Paraburkholderia]|uniref:LysR substrate-binding domain-containing protein n=1 Tax=Paraburkholderia TaxID=1822464 RepID=UPI0006D3E0D0|nr:MULTISPECIES: LysR substrate-binding domain-containing protein [Paraburkholderia]ALP67668.1 LysR family transcriptional regulator [Paraburkholderia caribensis]AUT57400.1 LysR family transcriptional regulator [Paraburkholderia caribensis]